jgi:hypothetical protein
MLLKKKAAVTVTSKRLYEDQKESQVIATV